MEAVYNLELAFLVVMSVLLMPSLSQGGVIKGGWASGHRGAQQNQIDMDGLGLHTMVSGNRKGTKKGAPALDKKILSV